MAEEVDLNDPQAVSNGIAQWTAAASQLNTAWQNTLTQIEALNNAGTWGGDAAGQQFSTAYSDSGGPDFRTTGNPVIKQVLDQGWKVQTAIENSLSADEMQALEMDIPVEGVPPR